EADRAGADTPRRADRRVHHGKRSQDGRGDGEPARAAGPYRAEPGRLRPRPGRPEEHHPGLRPREANGRIDRGEENLPMPVVVRSPTPLRRITNGASEVVAKGKDVDELIVDLERQFPGLRERLVEESGELRRFINLYVNQEDVRFLSGRGTELKDGDQVSIVPAIAGGA